MFPQFGSGRVCQVDSTRQAVPGDVFMVLHWRSFSIVSNVNLGKFSSEAKAPWRTKSCCWKRFGMKTSSSRTSTMKTAQLWSLMRVQVSPLCRLQSLENSKLRFEMKARSFGSLVVHRSKHQLYEVRNPKFRSLHTEVRISNAQFNWTANLDVRLLGGKRVCTGSKEVPALTKAKKVVAHSKSYRKVRIKFLY